MLHIITLLPSFASRINKKIVKVRVGETLQCMYSWGDNFGENLMNDKLYNNIAMQMQFLILDRECYVIEVSDRRPIIIVSSASTL